MRYWVRFAPEIMIKGSSVRKQLSAQLAENLKAVFAKRGIEATFARHRDRIDVTVADPCATAAEAALTQTPGVNQAWRVKSAQLDTPTLDAVAAAIVAEAAPRVTGKRFAVRARRKGTHPFTSQEIERAVGAALLAAAPNAQVDLTQPEVVVELELDGTQLAFVDARIPGLGGFPLGSQGEALALVSGGFDSTVASFMSLRRGVRTHFLFFNLGGTAHDLGVKQMSFYLWQRFALSHRLHFISVPFEGVVEALLTQIPDSYMGVMLKRLMLIAAERIADEMGIDALVTGESVAQVSSQTLRNLALIDSATRKLVLRPLAFVDKGEIITWAERIGARQFAETMPEYCAVISRHPVTHGSFQRLAAVERRFDFARLDEAIAAREVTPVDQLPQTINAQPAVPVVTTPEAGDEILDIRPPERVKAAPLTLPHRVVPFFALKEAAKGFDPNRRYLLYCDKGVLSQLHALRLRQAGFNQVYVFRPNGPPRP